MRWSVVRRMLVRLLSAVLLSVIFPGAQVMAQSPKRINFADLDRRESRQQSSTAPIRGLGRDSLEVLNRFLEEDGQERQRFAASSTPSTEPTRSDESSAGTAVSPNSRRSSETKQQRFVCRIYCQSGTGPVIEREFTGSSREAVAREIDRNSNEICRSSGFTRSSSSRFDASQCRQK